MAKRWNLLGMYWEERPAKQKGKPAEPWRRQTRPSPMNELTEEVFSQVLLKLRKVNYQEVELDDAGIAVEVKKGTIGATDIRGSDAYDPMDSPIVYKRKGRRATGRMTKEGKKEYQMTEKVFLRRVNFSRPNDLYLTFIHKELWKFDSNAVENLLHKYEAAMVESELWEVHGWNKGPPPLKIKSNKKTYNMNEYLEFLRELEVKKK